MCDGLKRDGRLESLVRSMRSELRETMDFARQKSNRIFHTDNALLEVENKRGSEIV
jgi:hypothetical protein